MLSIWGYYKTALLVLFPFSERTEREGPGAVGQRGDSDLGSAGQGCGCGAEAASSGSLQRPDYELREPIFRGLCNTPLPARRGAFTALNCIFLAMSRRVSVKLRPKGLVRLGGNAPPPPPAEDEPRGSGTRRLLQAWALARWGCPRLHRIGSRGEPPTEPAAFRGSVCRLARLGLGASSGKVPPGAHPGLCLDTLRLRRACPGSRRPQRQASLNGSLFSLMSYCFLKYHL